MKRYIAKVVVTLKDDVKDNRALVLDKMLKNLKIENRADFLTGRFYTFCISAEDKNAAHKKICYVCSEILSNPVVEKYKINSIEVLK